ncbi:MAG TPA: peptide deformylase [Gemmatimonadaceae bacterium]|nr:peptide deformylase [Gemmatimonadaceae bacterium]
MSLLDIYVLGAPILREETKKVEEVTDELRELIDDMFETMYAARGIGLAAPQVGRTERITVIDVDGNPMVLINPEIVLSEGKTREEEGCLSIPDIYGDVDRAQRVVVRALDRDGKPFEIDAEDLLARCMQHEIDHLHGRLFIDHLSLVKRRAALAKWDKLRKGDKAHTRKVVPEGVARHHHRDEEL